jgi:hypothetical protein
MPAPSRCDRVRVVPRRRVGRVPPARAEPIGSLVRRDELLVRVLGVAPLGDAPAELATGALAGEPQTLQ